MSASAHAETKACRREKPVESGPSPTSLHVLDVPLAAKGTVFDRCRRVECFVTDDVAVFRKRHGAAAIMLMNHGWTRCAEVHELKTQNKLSRSHYSEIL